MAFNTNDTGLLSQPLLREAKRRKKKTMPKAGVLGSGPNKLLIGPKTFSKKRKRSD